MANARHVRLALVVGGHAAGLRRGTQPLRVLQRDAHVARAALPVLVDGDARTPFRVFGAGEAITLDRAATAAATRDLVKPAGAEVAVHAVPGPRWPWFLACITACAVLWWRERRMVSTP